MTRSRKSARDAGARLERESADYLARELDDDRIDRRVKNGANDRGDIGGVQHMGGRIVLQCKNTSRAAVGQHLPEVEKQRLNDGALAGVLITKRHGYGKPGDQIVHMTLRDFAALLSGHRPSGDGTGAEQ